MSSLGRSFLKEIIKEGIIELLNLEGKRYSYPIENVMRKLAEKNLIEPLFNIYLSYGSRVPVAVRDGFIYIPIGVMSLPFPEHEVTIFLDVENPYHFLIVPLLRLERPVLYVDIESLLYPYIRGLIPLRESEDYDYYMSIGGSYNKIFRKLFGKGVTSTLIDELLPYLPDQVTMFVRKGLPAYFYNRNFITRGLLELLDKVSRGDRERIIRFLQSFPGVGYRTLKVNDYFQDIPPYFHYLLPGHEHEIHIKEDNGQLIILLDDYYVTRPLTEKGIITSLLPVNEEEDYFALLGKGRKVPLAVLKSLTVYNPVSEGFIPAKLLDGSNLRIKVTGGREFLVY